MERMIQHEELPEVDLSRRRFLKLGGLLGLSLGALSLPSLGWTASATDTNRETEQEPWLEASKKKKKSKKASSKKKSTSDNGSTDWQEMA
jgi:hypothetical protein